MMVTRLLELDQSRGFTHQFLNYESTYTGVGAKIGSGTIFPILKQILVPWNVKFLSSCKGSCSAKGPADYKCRLQM